MALRTDPSITRSKEEAKARAESLRKQIVDGGKDFATITRENSDSPSKTKGGECCCEGSHPPQTSPILSPNLNINKNRIQPFACECIDGLTEGALVLDGAMLVIKLAETCNRRINRKALQ